MEDGGTSNPDVQARGGAAGGAARIRLAVRADLPAILDVYNASVPLHVATADLEPQSMAARERWWDERDHARRPVTVAERGGRVVAWGAFTDFKPRAAYAPTAEISIYALPEAFGTGVGRALLDDLLARAPACGIDRILALCLDHNERSLRLFRSRGFEEWGRFPGTCEFVGVRRTVVTLGLALSPRRPA
jgi:phosphinothricin acetyltransferase